MHYEMADPVLTISLVLAIVLGGGLLLWMQRWRSGWLGSSNLSGARLPQGSFGWPIIGESLAFALDPPGFVKSHVERYGKLFKSSLFLDKAILGSTPEFAKLVTSNSKLFVNKWPTCFKKLLGPKALYFKDGPAHTSIKKLVQKAFLPEALRSQINMLETIVLENMASWELRGAVTGREATEKLTLDVGVWLLLGVRAITSTQEGKQAQKSFRRLNRALASMPVNLPGTAYNEGLKAKACLTDFIRLLIEKRHGQEKTEADTLGVLLAAREDPQSREEVKDVDDDMIADNLVFAWFAATDTTSTTLTFILKFLVDNPDVFGRIQAEQQEILKSKDRNIEGPRLSWEDTKKMVYTQKFFQEVQRTISVVPTVVRFATEDIEFQGHLIPKGWGGRPMLGFIHSDPAIYPNPEKFDPDRFDATPKPYTFLAFGAGPHKCPGLDLVKLISLIFIHHLATTYKHERAGGDTNMEYIGCMPAIKGGYPIRIDRRSVLPAKN